eukprot:TRINITY_DN17201_c0_g6_i1.p1 TRINITY_DN17201_c0_g6~~TRINITY_DN17201_c0_g6_i1.p1  ORF type:complete len:266 (+),score=46.07 TRINITY_DN17201_c0_g6_i1:382-1179(+)
MIHKTAEGKILVVAQMLGVGDLDNPFMSKFLSSLSGKEGKGSGLPGSDPYVELLTSNKMYYRWAGISTTPPITNDTTWILMRSPVEMSQQQLDAFRKSLNDAQGNHREKGQKPPAAVLDSSDMTLGVNNKPVQPLAGRVVQGFASGLEEKVCTDVPSPDMLETNVTCGDLKVDVLRWRSQQVRLKNWEMLLNEIASPQVTDEQWELHENIVQARKTWAKEASIPENNDVCTLPANPRLFEWIENKYCQLACFSLGFGYPGDSCTN